MNYKSPSSKENFQNNSSLSKTKKSPRILTEIVNEGAVVVNQNGARIENLKLDNQLLLTKVVRSDGKEASTHPCVPIWDLETSTRFGLKRHGDARNQMWEVSDDKKSGIALSYEVKDKGYPKGLMVTQRFTIVNGVFQLVTKCVNNGKESLPVNFGEHCYWNIPQESCLNRLVWNMPFYGLTVLIILKRIGYALSQLKAIQKKISLVLKKVSFLPGNLAKQN
jgi:galactose mutarotase-like enzyme